MPRPFFDTVTTSPSGVTCTCGDSHNPPSPSGGKVRDHTLFPLSSTRVRRSEAPLIPGTSVRSHAATPPSGMSAAGTRKRPGVCHRTSPSAATQRKSVIQFVTRSVPSDALAT